MCSQSRRGLWFLSPLNVAGLFLTQPESRHVSGCSCIYTSKNFQQWMMLMSFLNQLPRHLWNLLRNICATSFPAQNMWSGEDHNDAKTEEDKSLRFPQDFYEGMEKLQVISYDKMKYPMLPSSPQCSTNFRVIHLHECSLRMFDCSSIGNMLNLEVLSFVNSMVTFHSQKFKEAKAT
ncbi:unnamed protein product [Lactuca saligna]|uniref:Uncharacterized protein n=1 Tax=Lactuca saligna TaxID=75948 RepID=A0AA35V3E2_LACSI|nr:unnamed protein product [Lactuca saligna]